MKRLRVVLDTNCYISALARPGAYLVRLRMAWEKGLFVPVMCGESMAELEDVLPRPKFELSRDKLEWALVNVRFHAEMFVLRHPSAPVLGLRDPKDIVFVNLAREAKTDYLVSGDAHLLELKETITDVQIISPGDFLRKIGWSTTE